MSPRGKMSSPSDRALFKVKTPPKKGRSGDRAKKRTERTVIFGDTSVEAVIGAHQVSDDEPSLSVFTLAARVDDDAIVRILDADRVRDQRAFL